RQRYARDARRGILLRSSGHRLLHAGKDGTVATRCRESLAESRLAAFRQLRRIAGSLVGKLSQTVVDHCFERRRNVGDPALRERGRYILDVSCEQVLR